MKVLIIGQHICQVGECVETETALVFPNITFPKHIISGYRVVEGTPPADFQYHKYIWQDGFALNPNWPPVEATPVVEEATE